MFSLAFETERVSDAVPAQSGCMATLFRAIDRGRDVHAQAQIGLADGFHEIFGRDSIIEYRGGRGGRIQTCDDGIEIRLGVALPMRQRIHRTRGPQLAPVPRVAEVT